MNRTVDRHHLSPQSGNIDNIHLEVNNNIPEKLNLAVNMKIYPRLSKKVFSTSKVHRRVPESMGLFARQGSPAEERCTTFGCWK